MIGVDGELGIDEEEDCLLDGVESGDGSAIGGCTFHLRERFGVHIDAEEYIFA